MPRRTAVTEATRVQVVQRAPSCGVRSAPASSSTMRPVSHTLINSIRAPIDRVFALLTDPGRIAQWLPGCERGLDGRYDSVRVDPAVVRGVAPRALPGEAQGAESPQDHSGEPGEAGRVLTVQVARVQARRTPLAPHHRADRAPSDTLTVARPVQNRSGHENPRPLPIPVCRAGARRARCRGDRPAAARRAR